MPAFALFPPASAAAVSCSLKSVQWNFALLFIMSGVDVVWIRFNNPGNYMPLICPV